MKLCQTSKRYFDAWENGTGPKQIKKGTIKQSATPGPGTMLARVLREHGYSSKKGCGCDSKARLMNRWGSRKCRERLEEITDWLVDAAKMGGWLESLAVSTPGVQHIVRRKIKKAIVEAIERADNPQG